MRILVYTLTAASLVTAPLVASNQHAQTHGNPHTTPTGKPTTSPSSGKTTTPTTTTTTTPNPIAAKISSHPQLASRLTAMLPKGMTLNQASTGFKNQGQFIAALHVSQNLGCGCFKQLQTDMTKKHMSLSQAIQDVKKTANATVEAQRAETEAHDDVKRATTAMSTSTVKNNKKKTTRGGNDR